MVIGKTIMRKKHKLMKYLKENKIEYGLTTQDMIKIDRATSHRIAKKRSGLRGTRRGR